MSTGSFENWAGNITDIGVIYPFEGSEFILVVAGVIFWLVWQIKHIKAENQELDEAARNLTKEKLKALNLEDLDQ